MVGTTGCLSSGPGPADHPPTLASVESDKVSAICRLGDRRIGNGTASGAANPAAQDDSTERVSLNTRRAHFDDVTREKKAIKARTPQVAKNAQISVRINGGVRQGTDSVTQEARFPALEGFWKADGQMGRSGSLLGARDARMPGRGEAFCLKPHATISTQAGGAVTALCQVQTTSDVSCGLIRSGRELRERI